MPELEGRAAIVTGAGNPRGIGRAVIEALAAEGANIVATDIAQSDPDPIMQVLGYDYGADLGLDNAVEAVRALGRQAVAVHADVTKPEEVQALVKEARAAFGRVAILVNVAGGSWGSNRVADYEPAQWLKTLHVNLYGAFLTAKCCLQDMEHHGGCIVNVASVAAIRAHDMVSAYGAAKAGVVQFTRDVAVEYGPQGVRANAVLPGDIQTDMLDMELKGIAALHGSTPEEAAAISANSAPLRRLGTPEDVAALVAFLCMDKASFLTGLAIPVTGGKELPFRST